MTDRQPLNTSGRATIGVDGSGRVEIGPDSGPPYWNVTKVVVLTDRPGQAPVPQCSVYVDSEDANGLLDSTYDGSKDATDLDVDVQRGQHVIAVWTGGQPGDTATLSLTGWMGVSR